MVGVVLCVSGDYFLYMELDENEGIKNVVGLPSHEAELRGRDPTNPNYVQLSELWWYHFRELAISLPYSW